MSKYNYLTQEGYNSIVAKLTDLKTNGRQKAAQAIAEARDKGDLSENAEYDAAKDAQGMLELKINDLEMTLVNARIVDKADLDSSKITILCKATIKNLKVNKEMTYQLVAQAEADLSKGKISVSSPIGEGLLGHAVGDKVKIETPGGVIDFEVVKIEL